MNESKRWGAGDSSAQEIVEWIRAHGGEAHYQEPVRYIPIFGEAQIAIRTSQGWAYARRGDHVVLSDGGDFRVIAK